MRQTQKSKEKYLTTTPIICKNFSYISIYFGSSCLYLVYKVLYHFTYQAKDKKKQVLERAGRTMERELYFIHLLSYPNTAHRSFSSSYGQQELETLTKLFRIYVCKQAPTKSHFHRCRGPSSKVVLVIQAGSSLSSNPGLIFHKQLQVIHLRSISIDQCSINPTNTFTDIS